MGRLGGGASGCGWTSECGGTAGRGGGLDFWVWWDCGGVGLLGVGTSGGVGLLNVVGLLRGWDLWELGALGGWTSSCGGISWVWDF